MAETNRTLVASLRADVAGFQRDLQQAARSARDFGQDVTRSLDQVNQSNRRIATSTRSLASGFNQLKAAIITLGLGNIARQGFEAAASLESVQRTLVATTGGAQQAAEAYRFVREQSLRLGTDLEKGARAFGDMSDAARGTRLEGQGVKTIFEGLGTTVSALGLGNERFKAGLLAINQIMDRTKVQTQEVNQLTEAGIPIRRELTEIYKFQGDELAKSLEKGLIPAEALEVVFGRLLERFRESADIASQSVPTAFNILTTSIRELNQRFFQGVIQSGDLNRVIRELAGGIQAFKESLNLQEVVNFTNALVRLAEAVFRLGKGIAELPQNLSQSLGLDPGRNLEQVQQFVNRQLQAIGISQETAETWTRILVGGANQQKSAIEDVTQSLKDYTKAIDTIVGYDGDIADLNDAFAEGEDSFTGYTDAVSQGSKSAAEDLDQLSARLRDARKAAEENDPKKLAKALEDAHEIRKDALEREIALRMRNDEIIVEGQIRRYEEEQRNQIRAAEEAHQIRKDALEREIKLRQDNDEKIVEAQIERYEQEKKEAEKANAEFQRIFEHARDNIQDAFGDAFRDIFDGQIDSGREFFDSLVDLAKNAAAEIAAALVIRPVTTETIQSITKVIQEQLSKPLIGGKSGGDILRAAGLGIGAGFAGSGFLSQVGVSGTPNRILAGAGGGAVAGGSLAGPLGAIAGAVVGAIGGFLSGVFGGGGPKVSRLAVTTGAQPPTARPSDDALVRGAFGFISLIDAQSKRANAQQVAQIVAELDRTVFQLVTEKQRDMITQVLQRPLSSTIIGEGAKDTDEALAQVVAERLKLIVSAVGGQAVAETVVGDTSQATPGDIQQLQRRVEDALGILKLMEEFETGPLTNAAAAIKQINDEFANLISRAEEFGIATAALEEERQRRIAEIAETVNKDVSQRILDIVDPAAAAQAALAERQRLEYENARDANADLIELERLHALEREQLADNLERSNTRIDTSSRSLFDKVFDIINTGGIGNDPGAQIEEIFQGFNRSNAGLTSFQQQLYELTIQFNRLMMAAQELGRTTADLEESFRRGTDAIFDAARQQFNAFMMAHSGLTQSQQQIQSLTQEFQQLAREAKALGIPTQGLFAALQQGIQDVFRQAGLAFSSFMDSVNLTPTQQQIKVLTDEFNRLAAEAKSLGIPITGLYQSFLRGIDTIFAGFQSQANDFIRTQQGRPALQQELDDLTDQFKALEHEARVLGLSTSGLVSAFRTGVDRIFETARESAFELINSLTSPFNTAIMQANRQIDEFAALVQAGLIPLGLFDWVEETILATTQANEALRRISGAAANPIEQVADIFDQFVQAGNPLSQFGQELFDLTETFVNLIDAAQLLGLSTTDLERSYLEQSRTIRERLIEDIDRQLATQIQGIESINALLDSFRIDATLPGNLRLDEAQRQFRDALSGGDIQEVIGAASQLREIGRGQFGSGAEFFRIQTQIEEALIGIREREQAAVESERQRLIDQAEREQEQVLLGRSSLDSLRQLQTNTNDTTRGISRLIDVAEAQQRQTAQMQDLLERTLARVK